MTTQRQTSTLIYSAAAVLLAVPLIAMQFTTDVNWTISDFVIAAALLFTTAFSVDFVLKRVKTFKSRLLLIFGILAFLILIWAEMAVGIFGSPIAGN